MQQADRRILTPTNALGQVSWCLIPPAPCPPQGRSSREDLLGSGGTHRDAGSAPVLEPIWQLIPALRKEERREEEGPVLKHHQTPVLPRAQGWGGQSG